MSHWDLFMRQPLKLMHPADMLFMVAAVCSVKNGLVWWNFDVIVAAALPHGVPGSGFMKNPVIPCKLEFHEEDNEWWAISEKPDWIYKFGLPEASMIEAWDRYKKYVPSLEELTSRSRKIYGAPA